jgi:hypothetical protein
MRRVCAKRPPDTRAKKPLSSPPSFDMMPRTSPLPELNDMPATLTVYDESTTGDRGEPIVLEFLTEHITVRELIRQRVYQEVQDYNLSKAKDPVFNGLVRPTDAEQTLNGYKLKRARQIDWHQQFENASAAFDAGRVLVIINDRQAESLDERVEINPSTDVSFLKLVPLVGG